MPRKKVDERIRSLIENGVRSRQRSFLVIVGDHGKDQVVNLHYILSKATVKARPPVLWCYNKELGFSTHKQKRMRQIKKMQQRGLYDPEKEDPFELFVSSTQIRWCYYKETQRVLGNTFGMCVLQDFEAITPNIICRTIETVEGGGLVVLLLHTMSSLKQLYTLSMDVHDRFRTEAHGDVVGRFNERFILSLASCASCLVVDDELNVLPISKHSKALLPLARAPSAPGGGDGEDGAAGSGGGGVTAALSDADRELADLKASLASTELVGALTGLTRTLDQAKAVLTFAEAIAEKSLRSTVALMAGRGRGKSAALGLAIASAVGYGYSNIFVTSPSPENLGTLFDFVFKGLEALAYKEHADYEAVASTNPDFHGAIVRINVFRGHRQTIAYIDPADAHKLAQAELLVVDEAAAIPLPLVKALLGPYLVFLASTVNGYEGTGRSLSLKLVQQLRMQAGGALAAPGAAAAGASSSSSAASRSGGGGGSGAGSGRSFREVTLAEPIRYAAGDPIEAWLNDLLCLDATSPYRLGGRLPAPDQCALYAVDRDALFSYHKLTEGFLHRMMSLFVSSHYKNTPNDLQLMSDAPAHRLLVLLGPQAPPPAAGGDAASALPDVLCAIQVCLEGRISADSVKAALARGGRANGDLIPWSVSQQFQDDNFAGLSGARIVRVATHPDATKMGYGTRAIELLARFYEGKAAVFGEEEDDDDDEAGGDVDRGLHRSHEGAGGSGKESQLAGEKVRPRKQLPPLLVPIADVRRPARLHWLGVSYGLTLQLFNFWRRSGFLPLYLRQTANELTAEHTSIMLRPLDCSDLPPSARAPARGWHTGFVADFARRYMALLSFEFRSYDATLALSVLDAAAGVMGGGSRGDATAGAAGVEEEDEPAAALASSAAAAAPSAAGGGSRTAGAGVLTGGELTAFFTPHDLKRLASYARNLVDYHMVLDLLPDLCRLYFQGRLPDVSLPRLQAAILLSVGLQRQPIETISGHFGVPVPQALALFNKAVRKITTVLSALQEVELERQLDAARAARGSAATASAAGAAASTKSGSGAAPRTSVAGSKPAALSSSSSSSSSSAQRKPLERATGDGDGDGGDDDEEGGADDDDEEDDEDDDEEEGDGDGEAETEEAPVLSKAARASLLADPELAQYAVPQDDKAWRAAVQASAATAGGSKPPAGVTLSVRKEAAAAGGAPSAAPGGKPQKHGKRKERDGEAAGGPASAAGDAEVYDPRGRLKGGRGGGGAGALGGKGHKKSRA